MFIKTQDREALINLRNITKIEAEAYILYAYLTTESTHGTTWIKIGEFQSKDETINELNRIQKWIEQPINNVYEVTDDPYY